MITMHLFITGKPGVGKTTLVKRVIERLSLNPRGFYTEEIRENGERVGFRLRTFDGKETILAHVRFNTPFRVGRYCVSVENLENVGVPALLALAEPTGAPRKLCGDREGAVGTAFTAHPPTGGTRMPSPKRDGPDRPELIVIDELGRMELYSRLFQETVMKLLDSGRRVFGVIQDRANPFLDAIRARHDVKVIRVTEQNRERLVEEITRILEGETT